jgi:hypothetical protein
LSLALGDHTYGAEYLDIDESARGVKEVTGEHHVSDYRVVVDGN